MTHYKIASVEQSHITGVASNLSSANEEEIWASHRLTPTQGVLKAALMSSDAQTWLADGQPVCIFGIHRVNELASVGAPWMLSTDMVSSHTREFFRSSRKEFDRKRQDYSLLVNYADARNVPALRWLAWLGFEIMAPEPFGWLGLPFHRFQMEKK